jgi:septum formation protein
VIDTPSIILASNSPRRRELLRQIGIPFSVAPADVDEDIMPGEAAETYATRVARDKARIAAARTRSGIVIAADTIVVLDNEILGKPADSADAARMLVKLSGRVHRVITAVVIKDAGTGRELVKSAETRVWFRNLSPVEIAFYVESGEPLDKAGAYGIQELGALLVDRIEGCYYNVVGLPLSLLGELLQEMGFNIWSRQE